ncbi:hypothetical protein DSCO28_01950 [Desulfosarcina ovata subsp. sediminis]|uniref:Uncharacterized protein n=1 Tax=Desulfosarcina ovata subsp. sediminis TaxID=885957 RepID=A0A5K7ZIR1_9BACT|nr:hypothetical protein DSCO28_01950 [Desulfosarcina ovata subsp. sediminis]
MSLILYWQAPKIFGAKPFNFSELVIWFDNLSESFKTAIISSLLTIIGFLIAFQSATKNWKDQLVANIRLDASNNIDLIYTRISELINSIKIYADMNLQIVEKIGAGGDLNEIANDIRYITSQNEKFLSERQELSILHGQAYQLIGRYSIIFMSTLNSFDQINKNNEFVKLVADRMWVLVPVLDFSNPKFVEHYLSFVNVEKYSDLAQQCSETYTYVTTMAGNVRGKLTGRFMEFNLSLFYNLLKNGWAFTDYWFKVKKIGKKVSNKSINID